MPAEQVVQIPPSSSASLHDVDAMIGEVSSLIGGDLDPDARQKALTCLDRAADKINMAGVFLYRLTEQTYNSGSDFTDGAQTLATPTAWGWPDDRAYVYDTNNKIVNVMNWRDWETFRQVSGDPARTDVPDMLSMRSELDSTISVYPFISTSNVSKIIIPFFQRIQRPSEVATLILQPETREALIMMAQALIMQYRYKDKPNIWMPWFKEAKDYVQQAKRVAHRFTQSLHIHARPDETGQVGIQLPRQLPGTVFIRL